MGTCLMSLSSEYFMDYKELLVVYFSPYKFMYTGNIRKHQEHKKEDKSKSVQPKKDVPLTLKDSEKLHSQTEYVPLPSATSHL